MQGSEKCGDPLFIGVPRDQNPLTIVFDTVTVTEFASTPHFDLTIDAHQPALNDEFGMTACFGQVLEL